MFSMNVSLGSRIASSPTPPTVPPFSARYLSMNSHPSILRRRTCFWIFGAFRHSPSAITRHAPPRSRFVSRRGRSRCPLISTSSVPSPLIATGQFPAIRAISSSLGVYWRCWTCLYSRISSLGVDADLHTRADAGPSRWWGPSGSPARAPRAPDVPPSEELPDGGGEALLFRDPHLEGRTESLRARMPRDAIDVARSRLEGG